MARRNGQSGDVSTQKAMFDLEIESPELEQLLVEALRLEPEAVAFRKAKKDARVLIEQHFKKAINVDGEHGGYVRCGGYRFRAKAKPRAEGDVKIKAGINFTLDIELL